MCGIAGIHHYVTNEPASMAVVRRMTGLLIHRGPDADGYYVEGAVGLGVRRLKVIDLETGDQPLANEDGSIQVVLNGEIYNYRDLRRDLIARGHKLRSAGDTEVIAHLYEEKGMGLLQDLRGMFAFALWDARKRTLFLCRDRFGIKPLYYSDSTQGLAFASEMKSLLLCPWIDRGVPAECIDDFLSYLYVPGPRTIFRGIRKLPPAHYLVCSPAGTALHRYWALEATRSEAVPSEGSVVAELEARLQEAVTTHLVSDVPLGVFLSGGVDSSGVAALMARAGVHLIKTFSIGFRDAEFDERPYAQTVAAHLGTDHLAFLMDESHVSVDMLERLAWQLDEPLADPAALATHFLSQMTREHVTVALSGAGGDELFGGYPHYLGDRVGGVVDRLPSPVRRAIVPMLARLIPASDQHRSIRRRLRRFLQAAALPADVRHMAYVTHLNFSATEKAGLYTNEFAASLGERKSFAAMLGRFDPDATDFVRDAMRVDLETYLVDDILTMTDKMSMLHSLEVRVPLLDHPLVEFVASLPSRVRLRGFTLKPLLRAVVQPHCPPGVFDRAKHGFALPLVRWLRGVLGDTVRDVILDRHALARGYFRPREVTKLFERHAGGAVDESHRIWQLLMLELWHRQFVDACPSSVRASSGGVGGHERP
ncbi:MAG: asparagine synthase (glutamine-hydrolyzing) [Betaproteobacteria bacterium RIFCSPLOWO2_02_FULL_64_12]|nr:MAG: asparagine synthase (glutamine-hydrolyzing) [Betaproteobacteria bacterium RIFCSPLOWO2_02_FULL_64_12]